MMENQPAYGQEDEIDLVALTFTLLRKYRQILAAALACAIIFGAAAGAHTAWGGAVSQDAQKAYESELAEYNRKKESYEAAKQQYSLDIANNEKSQRDTEYAIQKAQEYAENSVWNNLDPYNVWMAQADLYVTTNYQIQPGMAYQNPDRTDSVLSAYASLLGNSSTLSEVAQQFNMQERYLRELVTISSDPDTHLLAITVMSSSEQTSSNILTALLEQVNAMNANITASVGSHTISVIAQSSYSTVSTDLRDAQTENSQNLLSLQTQIDQLQQSRTGLDSNFEDTTKEWESTEEPVLQSTRISSAVLKFGLIGLLAGIVLVCGVGTVQFLVQGKVYSGKELRDTCRLPLLGTLASGKTRQSKQLDAALDRMEHRPDGSTDAEMIRLMAATIASRAPEAKHILITGDLPADQLTALAAALQDTGALRAQVVTSAENILTCAELYGLAPERRKALLPVLAQALELTDFLDSRTHSLPLGQKQRLALLCATLHEPPVLFLDEPTSGVDARTRRDFWKHITAMTEAGASVLVTTHFMEEAEYCDRMALIYRGAMISMGTPDELKASCRGLPGVPEDPTLEDAFIASIRRYDAEHPQ